MKIFQCQHCSQPLFFENTLCVSCGYHLGYLPSRFTLSAIARQGNDWKAYHDDGQLYRYCQNHKHGVCNWLVESHSHTPYCEACRLNQTIPNLKNPVHLDAWNKLENAKHRLIYSLQRLNLPFLSKAQSPYDGLAFDFLSDEYSAHVRTGHLAGVITINASEADSVRREYMRKQLSEPYRTLIGHFRHEVGHYFWERLVKPYFNTLHSFRQLFGNEGQDYSSALERRYYADWQLRYVSEYASSHPWEDWAETWAHYMHLMDTLETAYYFGMGLSPLLQNAPKMGMFANFDPYDQQDFDRILNACIPLTFAVNSLNRGMGQPDFYPFVLPPPVVDKLRFIHQLIKSYHS